MLLQIVLSVEKKRTICSGLFYSIKMRSEASKWTEKHQKSLYFQFYWSKWLFSINKTER